MSKIVDCQAGEGFTWEGNPERTCTFKTEHGWFSRKAKEIPWEVQHAFGKVKAEVDPEPDADGCIQFIRFTV
jgi:hypothetical protein